VLPFADVCRRRRPEKTYRRPTEDLQKTYRRPTEDLQKTYRRPPKKTYRDPYISFILLYILLSRRP